MKDKKDAFYLSDDWPRAYLPHIYGGGFHMHEQAIAIFCICDELVKPGIAPLISLNEWNIGVQLRI